MEVERISTDKSYEKEHYFHKFRFKGVLSHIQVASQIQVIKLVFRINCNYTVEVGRKNQDWDEDIVITAHTTDKTPNNAINRSAWILRQLDKLIGLKLED